MTTNINIREVETTGYLVMDGHGAFPIFSSQSLLEVITEAIRRGWKVSHAGFAVVSVSPSWITYGNGSGSIFLNVFFPGHWTVSAA